jgi:molybdopterin molybdotransferase
MDRVLRSADEARALLAGFAPVDDEPVAVGVADGRVLAAAVVAPEDLPPWPRAAMDGFAIRADDGAGPRTVRAELAAGEVFGGTVGPEDAVAIATGATMPAGADAVVMLEHAVRDGARVSFARAPRPGENVVAPGEDLRRGDVVAARGRRLRPPHLAALVALGVSAVRVHRRPRVAVLATGSELVAPDATPGAGQIRDVNSTALAAQARRAGCDVVRVGLVPDDLALVTEWVRVGAERSDCLLLSGGSSVGAADLTVRALTDLGAEILFHGIDVKPGRPTVLARMAGKPVLGIPGVPASAQIIFEVFVRPLLWRLGGEEAREPWPARTLAPLARRVASAVGREDWLRVRLGAGGQAEPLPGGNTLSSLVRADGMVCIPAARAELEAGERVEVLRST